MSSSSGAHLQFRPGIDFDDVFASVLSTVAIYMASLTSLEVWRALRLYDSLTARVRSSELKQRSDFQRTLNILVVACLFTVECLFVYWMLAGSIIGARWGATFLSTCLTWMGLSTLAVVAVSDIIISRLSDDAERNRPYSIRTTEMHHERALSAMLASLGLAIYTAFQPSSTVSLVANVGLVFCLTMRPIFLMGKGWLSIRGAVYGCFALLIFLWFMAATYVIALGRPRGNDHPIASEPPQVVPIIPVSQEFCRLIRTIIPIVNATVGNLIALVFRYEFSVSGAAVAELYKPMGVSFEDQATPSSSVAIIDPGEFAVVIARSTTPFHAPLFNTMISIHALVHVPALILALSAYNSGPRPDCGFACSEHFIVSLLANTPPQVWALLIVPTLVLVASRTRDDGHNLWRYAERWVPPLALAGKSTRQKVVIGRARIMKG